MASSLRLARQTNEWQRKYMIVTTITTSDTTKKVYGAVVAVVATDDKRNLQRHCDDCLWYDDDDDDYKFKIYIYYINILWWRVHAIWSQIFSIKQQCRFLMRQAIEMNVCLICCAVCMCFLFFVAVGLHSGLSHLFPWRTIKQSKCFNVLGQQWFIAWCIPFLAIISHIHGMAYSEHSMR